MNPNSNEQPCERTSAWLLSHYEEGVSCVDRPKGDITVTQTAKYLGLEQDDVRECLTMLLRAHVLKNLDKDEVKQG